MSTLLKAPEGPLGPSPAASSTTIDIGITDPYFQSLFFLALPALAASVLFSFRLVWLQRHGREHHLGRTGWVYWPGMTLMLCGCVALVVAMISYIHYDHVAMVATGLVLLSWVIAMPLDTLEHKYSIRSSDFILGYYLVAILGSAARLFSWSAHHSTSPAPPGLALYAFRFYFLMLVLGGVVQAWPRGQTAVQQNSGASVLDKANVLSRLSFHYFQRIMALGYQRPLRLDDLGGLMKERIKSENAYSLIGESWKQQSLRFAVLPKDRQEKQQPWVLLKAIGFSYGWIGWAPIVLCRVASTTLVYLQPVLLGRIMDFMQSSASDSPQPLQEGILLAFMMFLASLLGSVANAQLMQMNSERGMEIRSGLVGLIYRKALRLSPGARQQSNTGAMTNHISVDAEKWTSALNTLPQWVSAPIEIVVALWMLYRQLGWCSLVGLFTLLGLIPVQNKVSDIFTEVKDAKLGAMDSRIQLVTELFTSIKVIKLYGWEDAFKSKIAVLRKVEMTVLRRFGIVYAAMTLIFSTTMFMSLLSFGIYATVGGPQGGPGEITPHVIFVSLALFSLLSKPISTMDHILSDTTSILVATRRIQKFLMAEELETAANRTTHRLLSGPVVAIRDGVFSWTSPLTEADEAQVQAQEYTPLLGSPTSLPATQDDTPTLSGINFTLPPGSLTAVVGRIGQGKSSLLSALIGDMYKIQGSVQVQGRLAYVAQSAFIVNCSVKDNILFGKDFDQDRYERILDACSLRQDLEMLPAGDATEIGERGINLSGGQKQRISLARAAYQDADIYLLDDPLSAVDAHVDQQLWQNLIGPAGLLKDKTRVLVTHGIYHLEEVDQILVLKGGQISEMGHFKELIATRQGFYQLNLEFSTATRKGRSLGGREDPTVADETLDEDAVAKDAVAAKITPKDTKAELVSAEKMVHGSVGWKMLLTYAKAASYWNMFMLVFFYILVEVAQVATSFWLQYWSDPAGQAKFSVGQFLIVYAGCTVAYMVFNIVVFYVANVEAAILAAGYLHDALLDNLARLPMSFFDTTPVGRIINRFSTDVDAMDEMIIWNIIDVVYCLVAIAGSMVVISVSTPLFLVVVPPLLIAYMIIQTYFIQTSQSLKRFMSITKSPLYQHFSETLAGVSTIRAMDACPRFIASSEAKADLSAETNLAFGMGNRWLKVRLESLGAVIVLSAALLAVWNQGRISASVAGLSLTYAINITMDITWLVRSVSELQNQLSSVERIVEYAQELRQEAPAVTGVVLPEGWPQSGEIVFREYSTRYREGLDLVLKDVSFEVQPGEKVGIVGRTGAGKSSLTLALFRMIEAADSYWADADLDRENYVAGHGGSITIDGIDIATLGLRDLRRHLSIIPQDPTLFAGTLRHNLDPFHEHQDIELWTALERAHLKTFISSLAGGLAFEVAPGGDNFSVGQRSLICLARALLRRTKILILDEATAAVDMETDELIQKTIREEFKDRTILTIAHRIKTVMDSDKILVLEKGRVEEFASPKELLKRQSSLFFKLAHQAGEI